MATTWTCRSGSVTHRPSTANNFANAREYAAALLAGEPMRRYTPLDVADWIGALRRNSGDRPRAGQVARRRRARRNTPAC